MKSTSSSNARFTPGRSKAQICVCRGSPAWARLRASGLTRSSRGKPSSPANPAPSRDPAALQRPPLPRRRPGHQRQVVIGPPALTAQIAPPADGTVLDWLRVDLGHRVPADGGWVCADGGLQQPPRLPLVGGKIVHLERGELPA